jgi:putative ABC transport system permease protein
MSLRRGNFKLAYRSLKAEKSRSFLTMLGIVIGVMSVALIVCIGQGVKEQISHQAGRYGSDILAVRPGGATMGGLVGGNSLPGGSSALLSENDLQVVQKIKGVRYAVPLSAATGSLHGDHTVASPLIVATTVDFPQIISQPFAYGGFFDRDLNSKTVVLGQNIAHKLFDDEAPLGQTLKWRGQSFIVAGVFSSFNAPPLSLEANFNSAAFVPYSTAQQLTGNVLGLYQILAKTGSAQTLSAVSRHIETELTHAHGGSDDITVTSAGSTSGSDQTLHLLTLLVVGVALIALIVGGVGIMDVMLVSVTERMHEIGLRKAIGATNQQIMRQFMAEAFVLSATGAVIGVALSCIAVGLLRVYTSLQAVLVWQVLVLAPVVAVAAGVLFGTAPALKAARKDPIEALRHE